MAGEAAITRTHLRTSAILSPGVIGGCLKPVPSSRRATKGGVLAQGCLAQGCQASGGCSFQTGRQGWPLPPADP
jgi:hypothetical protein